VEVNADHVSGSVEIAAKDFRQHTSENGLFTGDLRLEGSHTISNAYPIYTDKADERAANAIASLRTLDHRFHETGLMHGIHLASEAL